MPPVQPPLTVNMIANIARQTAKEFSRRAQHTRLTQSQARVLYHLYLDPGMSQVTLADRLDVHPVSVTQIVDRLVKAGWVRRTPHKQDRRALSLYLTDAAEPMLEDLFALTSEANELVLKGLSAAERLQLDSLLARVRDNLMRASADSAA